MGSLKKQIYAFGGWRLDPAENLLLLNGTPVPLTPKVFDTLLLLVENAGRLVTKDEFMKRVWPDSFVEDLALIQNLSQIRKALASGNGTASEGAAIETVPKRGYRFLLPVKVIGEGQPEESSAPAAPQAAEPRALNHILLITAAVIAVAGIAAIGWWRWHKNVVLAPTDRILVTDFENKTGDASFGSILKRARVVKLNESPFLNLVADSEVLAAAKDSASDGAISRQTALAVCNQVGARAVLAGQISAAGSGTYKITLSTLRCDDGHNIAESDAIARTPDEVLPALGLASDVLRERLGESRTAMGSFKLP